VLAVRKFSSDFLPALKDYLSQQLGKHTTRAWKLFWQYLPDRPTENPEGLVWAGITGLVSLFNTCYQMGRRMKTVTALKDHPPPQQNAKRCQM